MSGRDSFFIHASIFLDRLLRHFATDALSFLTKLGEVRVPSNVLLVSFDAVSLYTPIDIMEGVPTAQGALYKTAFSRRENNL